MKNRKTKSFVARREVAHQPPLKPLLAPSVEAKPQRLIVVLGMHRSGTSAITRSLQVMGVELGDRLMSATAMEGNAKGFLEDLDFNALNNEILNALGSNWHALSPIESGDVEILRKKGYFFRAVELLRQKIINLPIFGFKDPRVAKLLPFWKGVFSHCQFEVSYLLVVRHPLSVTKSLAKRDGFEAEQSYLMWLDHVITSLIWSIGYRRVLVDYDYLMKSPGHELSRIAKGLGLEIDPTKLESYKAEFLDEGLRHTAYRPNDLLLDDACPPLVREIYAVLLNVASGDIKIDDGELQNQLIQWGDEFLRIKSPLILADKFSAKIASLSQAVRERDGQISGLSQIVGERDRQIDDFHQAVRERDGQISGLSQIVGERDRQIDDFHQAVRERDGQISGLSQIVGERDRQIDDFHQAVRERDGQIANLSQIVALGNTHATQLKSNIQAIKASISWKMTGPARWLAKSLIGLQKTHHVLQKGAGNSRDYVVRCSETSLTQRPRVVHVIANFMTGGSSRLVVDLIEQLGKNYEQSVITSFIPDPPAYIGFEISEYRCPEDSQPFIAHLSRVKPIFIHVHYWGDCDEPWYAKAIGAAEALGIPVIENINTPVAPYVSPAISRYVYVSDYVKTVFGLHDSNQMTIYPGSDFTHFERDIEEPIAADCIGMVYRLEQDKLNEAAILPFIEIIKRRPKTRAIIVGGGSLLEGFQSKVREAGMESNFEFFGYVSYEKLPDLYRQMSVFIAPVWKESFGQVSPFAMNMRVPVCGYDIGAISEIVANPALVAPPGNVNRLADIVIGLLDSPEKISSVGAMQRARAQSLFSLPAMISEYSRIYGEMSRGLN
jgi:glycosyltransferase involved in cell wall biosynthesis